MPITRRHLITAASTAAASTAVAAALPSAPAAGRPRQPGTPPVWNPASVHDPDVVRTPAGVHVFGSHGAAARTADLMTWEQLTGDGVTSDNPLFDDAPVDLAEALGWARSETLWAPGVTRLDDGRFAYYYCACEGSSPRSALGLALAEDVAGPYRDAGILLRSGMGEPGEDPTSEDGTPFDARVHPNVIDADLFADADGGRWMVYGSFSGGIFLLSLDPRDGRPLPGQGYGRHLWGGNHARIEGPAVMHHPGTGWFYLFLTYGGLDADGGYNIRVARARHPEGPWLDAEGHDMAEVRADPDLPLFDDVTIAPYGTTLLGNHRFTASDGTPGQGYVSPGGCSPEHDPVSGDTWIAFHTRFPGTGERHEVRVHPVVMTGDGWPLVLPLPHDGLAGTVVPGREMAGDYEVVHHDKPISAEVATSRRVRLRADGGVDGPWRGRWRPGRAGRAVLELDGRRHEAVFARQWDADSSAVVTTFAALGPDGTTLGGVGRARTA